MTTKTAVEKKTDTMRAAAMKALPLRVVCPKCGKNRAKAQFGLRVMARDETGVPTRIARQSYCKECRG